jgi:hypothetical protein
LIHDIPTRFGVVIIHRRAGKTVAACNRLIKSAIRCAQREPQVAYIAPSERQARRIAWRYLSHFAAPLIVSENRSEGVITLANGAKLMVLGAENVHSLRGMYLDDVVLDEFAQMRADAWDEVLFPALLDREGSALISGTPMGENRLKELYEHAQMDPDWTALRLTVHDTGALKPEVIALAQRSMSPAKFAQEFLCEFNAVIEGAYFGELLGRADAEKRIGLVPYDPSLGVTVAVDLGYADAFAAWFLQEPRGGSVRAIRFAQWSYYDGYAALKREIDAFGYNVTRWLAPHDIAVHEQGTGKTRHEQAAAVGMAFEQARRMSLEDGIEATRVLLPRMEFDAVNCKGGLAALRQYRSDWDAERKIGSRKPVHDWTSHPADALRTYATALHGTATDWSVTAAELEATLAFQRADRTAGRAYSRRGPR